mgnify:FL=1
MDKKEKAEKIRLYYSNEMYEESEGSVLEPVIAEGKSDVLLQPVFNPLSRIVNNLYSLAFKNFESKDSGVKNIWDFNNFTISKKKLIGDAILVGESYLEVVKSNKSESKYIFHKFEDVEVEKDFGEILKFSFTGVIKQVDAEGEIEEVEIEKTYFKVENKVFLKVNEEDPIFIGDIMPVFEFNFGMDLYQALYYIDSYNELEAEARAIINIHSSPERIAKNLGTPKSNNKSENGEVGILEKLFTKLRESRFKRTRTIVVEEKSENKAEIKYIEMQNTWINSDILPKMKQTKDDFKEEFPEINLSLETGNIAIRTFLMANEGLRSKVSSVRDNFIRKIKEVDSYALNKDVNINSYEYSDIFEQIEDEADIDILNKKVDILGKINGIQQDERISGIISSMSEEMIEEMYEKEG